MLNISGIHEGFVLDHIQAGMSLQIYHDLKLDKLDCTVAIIKNAKSNKMGKKDIIKVECPVEALDLDVDDRSRVNVDAIGFLDEGGEVLLVLRFHVHDGLQGGFVVRESGEFPDFMLEIGLPSFPDAFVDDLR